MQKIILASGSTYRKRQLEQLNITFTQQSPEIDESRLQNESIEMMVQRLAEEKGKAIAIQHTGSWVISSDQSAAVNGQQLSKPGNRQRAVEQLTRCIGQTVRFYAAVTLQNEALSWMQTRIRYCDVRFRALTQTQIEHYLDIEKPFDCAGSFKCEGLGITLFESIQSDDPNTLIGLPLIALIDLLIEAGLYPLDARA